SKRSWNDSIANAVEAVETTSATAAATAHPFVRNFIFASSLTGHERIKTGSRKGLFLDNLKARNRPTIQTHFHSDEFLGGLDDLVHKSLILHRKPDSRGSMVPPGIGTVLIRSTHKAPAATAEQWIRRFHIKI